MTTLQSRVLTFMVGIPCISAVILLLPQADYLAFVLVAVVFIVLGSQETANLFRRKGYMIPSYLPYFTALFPLVAWFAIRGLLPDSSIEFLTAALFMLVLIREINAPGDAEFETALQRISGSLLTLFYPGLFAVFAVRITSLPDAGLKLFTFMILVFANDTAAYIFGSLFGRSSRKLFRASPNKSLVGFAAGFIFSIIIALTIHRFLPRIFETGRTALLAGIAVGITAIIGDLAESALKRSAVIKDSGDVIPGRGGILDTIDSIIFSAPFYYLILVYT
jgi:phosphatidate cytidylyltransferase